MLIDATLCEFGPGLKAGEARCRRCGFTILADCPPERIVKRCEKIREDGLSAPPAVATKVWNVTKAIGEFVADGLRTVDATTYRARLAVCEECPRREGDHCLECGCFLSLKARGRAFSCPLGKWPGEANAASAAVPMVADARRVLFRFPHGLGDAVQFTAVLRHLRKHRPRWEIHLVAKAGADSLFRELCERIWQFGGEPLEAEYDIAREIPFAEPDETYRNVPSTKVAKCLLDTFGIEPEPELCHYEIIPGDDDHLAAKNYLETVAHRRSNGRFAAALIHYQGNSARRRKNLNEQIVKRLCGQLRARGLTPIILDWDARSQLVDNKAIFCPDANNPLWKGIGLGDGARLAALISQAALFIGVDSGPLHVAAATCAPAIGVWMRHHPLHYFDLADNVTHLVPLDHRKMIRGDINAGGGYFERAYRFRTYRDLATSLSLLTDELLSPINGLLADLDTWVRAAHAPHDRTIVRDVYVEDCYEIAKLPIHPAYILDIGAHLGSFTRRARERFHRARFACVEPDPAHHAALRNNVEFFAAILPAAVSQASGPFRMFSSMTEETDNTGASFLSSSEINPAPAPKTHREIEPPRVRTLEAILAELQWPRVDLVKLDCEGCELSILENSEAILSARAIVGEYHDRARFRAIVAKRFADWTLRILRDGEPGLFRLLRP